jgi:hypothetical protein
MGENESQAGESLLPIKLKLPAPVLLTLKEAGGGLEPPWTAVKIRLDGDTDRIGTVAGAAEP